MRNIKLLVILTLLCIAKGLNAQNAAIKGYVFEVSIMDKKGALTSERRALKGVKLEVYDNTSKKLVLNIESLEDPAFKLKFISGNHYSIMLRKAGYLNKRLDAYINVKGCKLCFDGISDIKPSVVDTASSNKESEVYLANIEMEKVDIDKFFVLKNLYNEVGKSILTKESQKELDILASIAINNPHISFEIGSHTDSRGDAKLNWDLSEKRSKSVLDYMVNIKNVSPKQIVARGYGEYRLLNGCKDGVVCSESDHNVNRRTELKVLAIDNKSIVMSLEQILGFDRFEHNLTKDQIAALEILTLDSTSISNKSHIVDSYPISVEKQLAIPISYPDSTIEDNSSKQVYKAVPNDKLESKVVESRWQVRAGIFVNKANAQSIVDKVYLLGYPTVSTVTKDNKNIVIVGHYKSKEEAFTVVEDLEKNKIQALAEFIPAELNK